MGCGVQSIALRGLLLHKGPQALGDVIDLDIPPAGGHIAADDLAVQIDVVDRAIQAAVGASGHLAEGDVAISGWRGRLVRITRLGFI